jgi:hypothetical protein
MPLNKEAEITFHAQKIIGLFSRHNLLRGSFRILSPIAGFVSPSK